MSYLLKQMYQAFYYECRHEGMTKKQALNAALILHQLLKYLTCQTTLEH